VTVCDICGSAATTEKFDVFNESGAAIADICSDCEELLSADRCSVCGTAVSDHTDEGIAPHGDAGVVRPLCPDCRRDILFGEGGDPA